MHVISKKPFKDAANRFPNHANAIMETHRILEKGEFKNSLELKKVFPSLDKFKYINDMYIIDIGGNDIRLIARIYFENQRLFCKGIMTHAEYDAFTRKQVRKKKSDEIY